jgi:hypothetical protein
VLKGIIITHLRIRLGKCAVFKVHLMSEIIRKGRGSMRYRSEMYKIKPPNIYSEHKKDEYVETLLLGMRM